MRIRSSSESGERRSWPVLRGITRRVDDGRGVDDGRAVLVGPVVRSLLDGGATAEGGVDASAASTSPGFRRFVDGMLISSRPALVVTGTAALKLTPSASLAKPAETASQPGCG